MEFFVAGEGLDVGWGEVCKSLIIKIIRQPSMDKSLHFKQI